MSKMDPVPVPNRYRYRIYRIGYFFSTDSVPTFDIFGTGSVLVFTGFYPQIPIPIPYRYWYPLLRIFGTGTFGTELIPSLVVI
ncbi:hypothetical protein Hanom_Chr14g01282701 [Helianthus anomalus]